jgi:hypothetical protein
MITHADGTEEPVEPPRVPQVAGADGVAAVLPPVPTELRDRPLS